MKNNYLPLCCLLAALSSLPLFLPAQQCGITVDAGEDVTLCGPFTPFNMNGSVDGPYVAANWSPPALMSAPGSLHSPVNVSQTTTFVLKVRTDELGDNLLVNPDFEQGNTGFSSDFDYSPGNLTKPDVYDVLALPNSANDAFKDCGDHTSGTGNMLAVNMVHNDVPGSLWCQTVPVTPNTDYYFSYWVTKLNLGNGFAGVRLFINGQMVSSVFLIPGYPECEWINRNGVWNSGFNVSANLCIVRYKSANPLALDDLFFGPFCEVTDTVTIFVENVDAVATPSYTIPCSGSEVTLSGAGSSVGPNYSYQWDTPDGNIVSGENTLYPVVNAPGTYTLTVTLNDAIGECIKTATAKVNVFSEPVAWVTGPSELNCYIPNALLQGFSNLVPSNTYQWTAGQGGNIVSGANNPTAVVNQPGDYTLVVTNNATGCSAEATFNIGSAPHPAANATAAPITCATPQTTLSGAGSSIGTNISYAWSTTNGNIVSGQNSLNAMADAPGTYVIAVTNTANGCSKTDTVVVTTNNSSVPVAILPPDKITCLQTNVTLATDSATGGTHHTYAWTASAGGNIVSGGNSLSPVVNAPGLYILQVTDTLSACTGTDTVLVAADNDAIIAIANATAPLTCVNASVTLDADGSTADPQLVYQWSTSDGHIVSGADTPVPIVDAPGTYTLLLSNPVSGCSATDAAEVLQNTTSPPVSILPYPSLSCAVPLVVLQGQNASPAGSFSYDWTAENGGHIFAGDSTLTLCVDAGGTYILNATDLDNGCTASVTAEVSTDFALPDLSLSVSGTLNCNAASVNLLNNSATDPALLDHQWTLPDGSGVNTGTNPNLIADQAGAYTLLLSNLQNGCTATASVTVVQHDNVTVVLGTQQNATCFGALDGALGVTAAGGNGAYTYLWSNNANTPVIANLGAGIYTVTVTDGENCTVALNASVTEPAQLTVDATATPPSVNGAADGTATANPQGGTPPYTFAWDNGETTQAITGLVEGFYTVMVTDAHGCTAVQTVEVTDGGCNVSATFQTVDPLCHGSADGQATAIPLGGSAPFTYLWTSGSTEQTATGLAAGDHGVTLTDANGCPFSTTVSLSDPALLILIVDNTTDAVCPNSSEGSATVLASGGTGTNAIEWSNGQSGPTATGLSAGTYIATATDANGCTATATATIQALDLEPPLIIAAAVIIPLGPSGAMELTLQNLGATVIDNCGLAAVQITPDEFDCFDLGEQQVLIAAQDNSGNNSTQTITVTFVDTQVPVLECPANIVRCHGNNIVEYPAPVAIDNCLILGGTFDLTEGLPSGSPFPQGTTKNAYTYTDVSGNTGDCFFQVTILSPLTVNLDAIIHDVDNQHIGGIQVTVGGSMPGYTYEWLQNGQVVGTTEDLSGIGMGVYTLLVTDDVGCKTEAGPYEVTSLVAVNDPDWADLIAIYPNPSSGKVFAVLPDELVGSEVSITVFDGTGRKVLELQSSMKKQVALDLEGFADGLYSVLLRIEQGQTLRKIVVSR